MKYSVIILVLVLDTNFWNYVEGLENSQIEQNNQEQNNQEGKNEEEKKVEVDKEKTHIFRSLVHLII